MIIMGVDPGTVVMGYGILNSLNDKASMIEYGAINTKARSPIGERLFFLYTELGKIIERCHPDVMAVEQPFVSVNPKSALAIGRAQAIAILAAANNGLPIFEYTPAKIKQQVANYGRGSKEQIQQMVKLQLGLRELPEPADAADALAIALCHLNETRLGDLLARQK